MERNRESRRWPNSRAWSEMQPCPDCKQRTLRVYWFQRAGEAPKAVDEFCDNAECTRGDRDWEQRRA